MSQREYKTLETRLIHAGEPRPRIAGAVSMPVFQSSTFEHAGETDYYDIRYIRLNNTPNHRALHEKLAALEGGEAALVTASGMAAISTALFSVLGNGDHLLAQSCLYGGTHDLLTKDFPAFGIGCDFIDGQTPESWERLVRPTTRAIYVESLTNPLMQVADLEAVVEFARRHQLISLIDNTFTSPVNFRPLEIGFDLSLHSASKYLNGHSDIVAGVVVGGRELIRRVSHKLAHLGGSLDPHACFLLHRGLKTLAVRVRYQNDSALELARFLERHPAVGHVNYPGLESHPQRERAGRLFDGFGGMLSLELGGGVEAARQWMEGIRIPLSAPSLGGVETLVTRPASTSHSGMSPEDRRALGISDSLVRISVGLENPQELMADFEQAFESIPVRTRG